MAAVVTRELTVTYAGLSIGGTSDTHMLFDTHEVRGGYETVGFTGRVLVCGSSEANLATNCASLETAFQTPNGALVITQGSSTMKSFGHSGSTGFLGRPSYRKIGGREDTGRSRLYEVRVDAQRPGDLSGNNGLRVAEISVKTNFFGSRSYRVSGTYTAISSTSARAQYAAQLSTYLGTIESDLAGSPGTWLRLDADVRYDDKNKLATFTQDAVETGFREGSYSLATTQTGLRSYRVAGVYTAVGGTGATATYVAAIGALLSAFETALTGTWLRGASSYSVDQGDKLIRFEYSAVETGLRDAVYEVVELPTGAREYRLTGQYEKVSSTGALATFLAAYAAILTTWESALTGTWERQPPSYRANQNDTLVDFTATARELIYAQSRGTLDNTTLRNTKIRIERMSYAPGDSSTSVSRPVRLMVSFDTDVVKSASQDLEGLWGSLVLPRMVEIAKSSASASSAALIEARPAFDYTGNRISGTLLVETYVGSLLAQEIETEDDDTTGKVLVDVYSGDPDEKEEFDLPRERRRTITTRTLSLNGAVQAAPGNAGVGGLGIVTGQRPPDPPDGYVLLRTIPRTKRLTVGLSGYQVDTVLTTTTDIYQFRKKRAGGSGDGRISTGLGLGDGGLNLQGSA